MADPHRRYEIRCPVHGFITISDWEREIISQPAFQRLRRIRQLAWTDQVYPGAMHTRFEHSLGVMHVASRLYDAVVERSRDVLGAELTYTNEGLARDRIIVRLAALLHDTGHSPFSHAGEDLFPTESPGGKHYKHEAYSAATIRHVLRDVIENHPLNKSNYDIKAEQVAKLLEGTETEQRVFWRELIDGQMDADRMDYLLRDSLHCGVDYGRYDWRRLLNTIQAITPPAEGPDATQSLRLGVTDGGIHAAEALVLARYYMFTQVYFHKTRVAYDHHIRNALKDLLGGKPFPEPTPDGVKEYLLWDDWRVLGMLGSGQGGEHGGRLASRNHFRQIYQTPESPTKSDLTALKKVRKAVGDLLAAEVPSKTSAYKLEGPDIMVITEDTGQVRPLSHYSAIVRNLNANPISLVRLYARPEHANAARARAEQAREQK